MGAPGAGRKKKSRACDSDPGIRNTRVVAKLNIKRLYGRETLNCQPDLAGPQTIRVHRTRGGKNGARAPQFGKEKRGVDVCSRCATQCTTTLVAPYEHIAAQAFGVTCRRRAISALRRIGPSFPSPSPGAFPVKVAIDPRHRRMKID